MSNPGAIAVGVLAGLGTGIVGAIPIIALAGTASVGAQTVLILLGLAAQFVAGYVAARIARLDMETHGGLAGIGLFFLVGAIALSTSQPPGIPALLVGSVTALLMGTLGGFLARSGTD
jgi:hypothetical protein